MKKLGAILFFSLYLLATSGAFQLMKLPVLFDHYTEHQVLNPSISFIDYVILHYINDSPKDVDHDRDLQLPFKTLDQLSSPTPPAFIPEYHIQLYVNSSHISLAKIYLSNDFLIPCNFHSGIWQPPKQA
jgi:hypothetical protein